MKEGKSLFECGIKNESTLHLVLRLRGGMQNVVRTLTSVKGEFKDEILQIFASVKAKTQAKPSKRLFFNAYFFNFNMIS